MDYITSILNFAGNFFNEYLSPGIVGNDTLSNVGLGYSSIVSYIGGVLGQIFLGILIFLPSGGALPQVFHDASQYFGNALATVNFFFPVSTLVYCMTLVFSVKIALWSIHLIRIVVGFVRGVSTERYKF